MEKFNAVIGCIVAALLLWGFFGCTTTSGVQGDAAGTIGRNQRADGRVEAIVESLDGLITDSRQQVADALQRARQLEGSAARIQFLFNEYQRIIEQLLNEVDTVRAEAKRPEGTNN